MNSDEDPTQELHSADRLVLSLNLPTAHEETDALLPKPAGSINSLGDNLFYVEEKLSFSERGYSFLCFIANFRPLRILHVRIRFFDMAIFLLVILLNLAIIYITCGGDCLNNLKEAGKSVGTLIQWNFAFVLLPVPRNNILLWWSGVSFEGVVLFHKWIARWLYVVVCLHLSLMTVYYHQDAGWSGVLSEFTEVKILAGIMSFICLTAIVLTSLPPIRRRLFDIFMKTHYICFIGAIIGGLLHKHGAQFLGIVALPMILYGLDVMFRFFRTMRKPCKVTSISVIGERYIRIHFKGLRRYDPGQHVYVYIPEVSAIQAHPYSLITTATSPEASILVQVTGGWTKELKRLVERGHSPRFLWIDGPYGSLSIPLITKMKTVVFVAGGIGITPIIALVKDLQRRAQARLPGAAGQKVVLIWSSRSAELFHEFSEEMGAMTGEGDSISSLQLFHTGHHNVSQPPADDPVHSKAFFRAIARNRPDFKAIFRSISKEEDHQGEVGVYTCGSRSLTNAVLQGASSTLGCRFVVHVESFEA